jgi:hypothetical protein
MNKKRTKLPKENTTNNTVEVLMLQSGRSIVSAAKNDVSMFFPDKDSWRNRLKYTMIDWAERDTSLDIYSFYQEYRIPRQTFYDWITNYPDIKAVHQEVMLTIGCRKRLGALMRKFDKDVAFKDMYKYDPEWKEIDHHLQTIKNDLIRNQQDVFIKMYAAPNTDVPELPTRKDIE